MSDGLQAFIIGFVLVFGWISLYLTISLLLIRAGETEDRDDNNEDI